MGDGKYLIVYSVLVILGILIGYSIAFKYNLYTPANLQVMQENSVLLSNYQDGFKYCEDYCASTGEVGYLKAVTTEHLSCLCVIELPSNSPEYNATTGVF